MVEKRQFDDIQEDLHDYYIASPTQLTAKEMLILP